MPELVRAPTREVRSRVFDSARWAGYQPRPDDIIIGTYSKCGTTWMQRIVSMLVLKSAEPVSIGDVSPWPDMRFFGPIEATLERAEAQTHRRFFKTHLPIDALPLYQGVKVIHVARDGRDAALSLHNHLSHFTQTAIALANQISLADPKFGDPWPTPAADPADFFAGWIDDGGAQGDPAAGFWQTERAYWAARKNPDVLLVHYADLKADRIGEMRRVADFLDIEIPEALWPDLVAAAGFEAMKASGDQLVPFAAQLWDDGPARFLHKGVNGRWQGLYRLADLAAYDGKVAAEFTPALAAWVASGRLATTDPRLAPD